MIATTDLRSSNGTATLAPPTTQASPTAWTIDTGRSRAEFSIAKRMFWVKRLTVVGSMAVTGGTLAFSQADPLDARIELTLDATTVQSGNARRDAHLHKAEFFAVDRFPTLDFVSRSVSVVDRADGRYRVAGDLTVRGVAHPVELDVHYRPAKPSGRDQAATIVAETTLNRRTLGMSWSSPVISVADEFAVTVTLLATPTPGAEA